ncbi:uncharacterized protein MELLADRAFT_91846 [Melampsora larici-populina 98AG31]|uniref:Uncharacterized protein n=1 Tax=Melampsora larici-populina (strain 98AG31 / pathotype 3-4-7) TaxID=747676 RepID=F4S0K3_MELLP|nr:uncharacterized protein MELLADRAFT_91846 [Melampsora larici-populina 98AG31]EGG01851.1 hypothetical protein MELLADRAFT_91846 [Melampsora larici-populina 98AG31]
MTHQERDPEKGPTRLSTEVLCQRKELRGGQVTLQTVPGRELMKRHATLRPRPEACARRFICSVAALPGV